MKWSKIALAATLIGAIYGVPAWAQVPVQPAAGKPVSYFQVADVQTQGSPSDAAKTMEMGMPTMEMMAAEEAPAEEEAEEEEEGDPMWRLFGTGPRGWSITGWAAAGIAGNPQGPTDRFNGPVTWPDRSNDLQFNELYTTFKKDAVSECDGWGFGGRVDLVYGSNYRFITSAGLESRWNTGAEYGLAMPNAYAEVAKGKFKTKLGHFTSPVGYFAVGTGNNFFNVLPYTFQYGEPFTHTGFITTAQVNDDLSVGAGLINGWDSTANWDSTNTVFGPNANAWNRHCGFIGTATQNNLQKEGDSLAYVGIWSLEPDATLANRTSRYLQTIVYSRPLTEKLQYVFQSDFGAQSAALANGQGAQWYGVNQYMIWTQNDCWKWGANFEWFRDDDGFRVVGATPSFGSPAARSFGRGPFQGDFFRMMAGPSWTPHNNVVVRPAIVYDWYQGPGAGGLQPYDDGTKKDQLLLNLDVVVHF